MSDQERPLRALGLANEAELGSQLWRLHQQWMYEDTPTSGDEVLAGQAALGRQVNQLLLGWMDRVLAREGVRKDQAEMLMTLAPTLEMARRRIA